MNSVPGRLTGGGIRTIPEAKRAGMLRRLKIQQGKGFRVVSIRYRVTGFRDPESGDWVSRNPRNGSYYRMRDGRHRTKVRPTAEMLAQTNLMALEVEVDRGKGSRIYYVSVPK